MAESLDTELQMMWKRIYAQCQTIAQQEVLRLFGSNVRGGALNPAAIQPSGTPGQILTTTGVGVTAWASPSGGGLTSQQAVLSTNVSLSANTWTNLISVALTAGTWLLTAQVQYLYGSGNGVAMARLWDGSSVVYSSLDIQATYNNPGLSLSAIAVLTGPTTLYLAAFSNGVCPSVRQTTPDGGAQPNCTQLNAVKIG